MRVAIFSAQRYERALLDEANVRHGHDLVCFRYATRTRDDFPRGGVPGRQRVRQRRCRPLGAGKACGGGTKLVATRSTGFNHIDVPAATEFGIKVVRVTNYSPNSVAEFAVGLLLALNRNIPRAYNRTRDGNFSLEGLMGFDLANRTVAVIGTGKIGRIFARIMVGFGCDVIGLDVHRSPEFEQLGGRYVDVERIGEADVISLHCPLTPQTYHIVNSETLARVKRGALLINTSRGGLIDTEAVIEALRSGHLGGVAIDVYEQEAGLFFKDLSTTIIPDDVIQRLVSLPNVIVTWTPGILNARGLGNNSGDDPRKRVGIRGRPPPHQRNLGVTVLPWVSCFA